MITRVGFLDNFVSQGGVTVNVPILVGSKIVDIDLSPCGGYHIAVAEDGNTYRRSVNYAPTSPYGWERYTLQLN